MFEDDISKLSMDGEKIVPLKEAEYRPGEIVTCTRCGGKHEMLMARYMGSITWIDGVRVETRCDVALPGWLFFNCCGETLLPAALKHPKFIVKNRLFRTWYWFLDKFYSLTGEWMRTVCEKLDSSVPDK